MSRRLTRADPKPVEAKRKGKYDQWLDGSIYSLQPLDLPWCKDWSRAHRLVRYAAKHRGLRLWSQRLEDGALAVQALKRKPIDQENQHAGTRQAVIG